ncbi:hypothetical protein JMJ58_20935 (plasmid) [Haloterrigena salifodinae]|uniref:NrS-1 polymerase-like HBD domain-containing protein n=1 Tax=Haloterrigena salifodinae TaxID=2675099 RepID=A0A8T8E6C2_9EURY|nr:hypothetical protein [Haloterrigena salifodinae]QRV17425.1 hypothetical protein JMJ58_20935 [Haloterrigena salifodinae]
MTTDQTNRLEANSIPESLRERSQWICWRIKHRDGKATKVPIIPGSGDYASATDAETWRSFDEALEYAECGEAAGIGYVFTGDGPFVGIDLDDCRNPETGAPSADARAIIDDLDSFTEVSPSGTGYHVIVRGSLPGDRSRRGSVEMYETARFFTVTGDHVDTTPERVYARPDALESVYNEYIAETELSRGGDTKDAREAPSRNSGIESDSSRGVDLEDEELLERARNASNGEKFEHLWQGSIAGYESQSEADIALCCLLAFWTGRDAARVDRLFRQSGLLRDKWDEVHYSDGSTYGEKTVERAIANTNDVYEPPSRDERDSEAAVQREQAPSSRDPTQGEPTEVDDQTIGGTDGTRAAYLAEKNRLLTDRVDELEATLEQKNERIDQLEVKIEELQTELESRDRERRCASNEQAGNTDQTETVSESATIWSRTKRLFGSTQEER